MTTTAPANKEANRMKVISIERIIKKAANSDGDSVTFLERMENREEIIYEVVLYNSRTGRTLKAYSTAIGINDIDRKHLERAAQETALAVFKEACDFMGIDIEEED